MTRSSIVQPLTGSTWKSILVTLLGVLCIHVLVAPVSGSQPSSAELTDMVFPGNLPNGFKFGDQQAASCGFVFDKFKHLSRQISTQNLDRNNKIVKFIENCYKTADGWRFKKSSYPVRAQKEEAAKRSTSGLAVLGSRPDVRDMLWKQYLAALRSEAAISALTSKLEQNAEQENGDM